MNFKVRIAKGGKKDYEVREYESIRFANGDEAYEWANRQAKSLGFGDPIIQVTELKKKEADARPV